MYRSRLDHAEKESEDGKNTVVHVAEAGYARLVRVMSVAHSRRQGPVQEESKVVALRMQKGHRRVRIGAIEYIPCDTNVKGRDGTKWIRLG